MQSYVVPKVTAKPDNRPEWQLPPPSSENPNINLGQISTTTTTWSSGTTDPSSGPVTTWRPPRPTSNQPPSSTTTATPTTTTDVPETTTTAVTEYSSTSEDYFSSSSSTTTEDPTSVDCSKQDFHPHPTDCSKVVIFWEYHIHTCMIFMIKVSIAVLLVRVWKAVRTCMSWRNWMEPRRTILWLANRSQQQMRISRFRRLQCHLKRKWNCIRAFNFHISPHVTGQLQQ